jgi:hypothetical protein
MTLFPFGEPVTRHPQERNEEAGDDATERTGAISGRWLYRVQDRYFAPERESMKLTHLGDALDHWKGSLIELIGGESVRVVPMLTDRDRWTEQHIETYARLLHLKPENILKKEAGDLFSSKTRGTYFRDLGQHDLFLDPDTGIAPDKKKEHVSPSEIAGLLSGSASRMLLIYQHASRKKNGLREKLNLLRSTEGLTGCGIFAYDSGAVAMVVISRNRERNQEASARLKCWLGPIAAKRTVEPSASKD